MLRYHLYLILLLFLSTSLSAQKQITHQQLHWYGYFNTLEINDKWALKTDFQERRFFNPDKQHQFVMRTVIYRSIGNGWQGGPGLCYFLQSPQDPNSTSTLVVPEIRPFVDIVNRTSVSRLKFQHRFRAEARFFHNTLNDKLVEGYQFGNFRLRYIFGMELRLWEAASHKNAIYLKLSDEVLLNFGNRIIFNTFDNNRIYVGLQYELSQTFSLEAGYLNWFQQRPSGVDYFDRNIVRLALNHKIKIK